MKVRQRVKMRVTIVRQEKAHEYTRAMIEDGNIDVIWEKKTEIDFSDNHIAVGLPATNSSVRVIIMEGAPGEGKSTLVWELCRRWEKGEIAQQYQLVLQQYQLVLPLRQNEQSQESSTTHLPSRYRIYLPGCKV